jgi:hypothetical protein
VSDVPLATTLKVAELPAITDCAAGWVVIVGLAGGVVVTVSVAVLLVMLPALFDTTTENFVPVSAVVSA